MHRDGFSLALSVSRKGERANTIILSEHMREGNAKMCGKSGYRHLSVDFARDLLATNLGA